MNSNEDLSGEGLVMMILIRNNMWLGFSCGITDCHLFAEYFSRCCVGLLLDLQLQFFFVKFGKRARRVSIKTCWKRVERGVGGIH